MKDIATDDIVRLKTVAEYEEDGDEITELVEKFAGSYAKVIGTTKEINEFGERSYAVLVLGDGGFLTITDHEVKAVYKGIEY